MPSLRHLPIPLLAIGLSSACGYTPYVAEEDPETLILGEVIVGGGLSAVEADALGLVEMGWDDALDAGLYAAVDEVDERPWRRVEAEIGEKARFIEPNRTVAKLTTNDAYRDYQWNLDLLDIDTAWDWNQGAGVTVAVVDTGVSARGEDRPARLLAGYDFYDEDSDPNDEDGHGTHVAGTIAQATNNGLGCAGVAPGASILPVRVLGPDGGSTWDVARGIRWAADQGAQVINLSLGGGASTAQRDAVRYAVGKGAVLVAASGNESASRVSWPAAYEEVIAVGAVGADRRRASYSNVGDALDVVAPGGTASAGILQETVQPDGQPTYAFLTGTSMATPHVAGVAALLIAAGAAPSAVPDLLRDTATDLGAAGWDRETGHGLIDPVGALEAVAGEVGSPTPAPGDPAPALYDVRVERSGRSLTVSWRTDVPATTVVEFQGYGDFALDEGLRTQHAIGFNLSASGTYTVRVKPANAAGDVTIGAWITSAP